ncbi:MAG TPA: branched-chain amino acid ABC transporter permease [Kofleriaceae bacterium]|nr:branched-chain amino acid ABC transporter permease [Kofleriaceae bacterium]
MTAPNRRRAAVIAVLVVLCVLPHVAYPVILMKMMCFALFACAFNLLIGYTGLLSFGHAMFFGAAGYASAHAAKVWGLTPELAVGFGVLVAASIGLVVGRLAIRLAGIYFAMITLSFAQMIFFFCLQSQVTGGENGIQAVPRGELFGFISLASNTSLYYFVLVVCAGGIAIAYRAVHSPFGEVLAAIRENEPRAVSLGYHTDHHKLIAFVLSAALAGLAGGTKVLVFQLASLTDVQWTMSGEVVLMALVGGLGTTGGPLVGAALVIASEDLLTGLGAWISVIQGFFFVLCVVLFRRGIVGSFEHWLERRK